jgi:hypothetical protein
LVEEPTEAAKSVEAAELAMIPTRPAPLDELEPDALDRLRGDHVADL